MFMLQFNCIGILFFRRGSIHRTRNENGSDKFNPYLESNILCEKSFEF